MNKPLKFIFAMMISRFFQWLLKKLGRNATHFPGEIALKLCPDFLRYIGKPQTIIGITGTNGKTTVANMIGDVLRFHHVEFAHNSLGSNVVEGIISTLLEYTSLWGNPTVALAVLEIDERASLKIFPYVKPDYLVITNLFRDSYKRNAHIEFIVDILNQFTPKETFIITNADDAICSTVCLENKRMLFGIKPQFEEPQVRDSIIKDIIYCPKCNGKIEYSFVRYHHIGRMKCLECGFQSSDADVSVEMIDKANKIIRLKIHQNDYDFPLISDNITDSYNMVAAIACSVKFGFSIEAIHQAFSQMNIVKTRLDQIHINDKTVMAIMAKDQNPVANSRVFDFLRRQDPSRKLGIIVVNEVYVVNPNPSEVENIAWIYDADFEYLNQPFIKQIVVAGHRAEDYKARMLLANIKQERIQTCLNGVETIKRLDFTELDTIAILFSTKNVPQSKQLMRLCGDEFKAREEKV